MLYGTAKSIYEYAMNNSAQFSNAQTVEYDRMQGGYTIAQEQYAQALQKVQTSVKFPRSLCFECNGGVQVINRLPA